MVTPGIRALRRKYPDAEIHFLTGMWSSEAIQTNPHIDNIILVEDDVFFKKKLWKLLKLRRELKAKQYDLAIIFQPSKSIRLFIKSLKIGLISGLSDSVSARLDFSSPWRTNREAYVGHDFFSVVSAIGCLPDDEGLEFHIPVEIRDRVLNDMPRSRSD